MAAMRLDGRARRRRRDFGAGLGFLAIGYPRVLSSPSRAAAVSPRAPRLTIASSDAGRARSVMSLRRCVNFRDGIGSPDRGRHGGDRCALLIHFRPFERPGLGCTCQIGGRPSPSEWPAGYFAFISMNAKRLLVA